MARDLEAVALLSQDPAVDTFLSEFQAESDRAAAVLGPAMLDEVLKGLLSRHFVSGRLADQLLGRMAPVATFSARITLAEALALISAQEARDLHTLREIRNVFAHRLHGISFETQSIRDRCANLVAANLTLQAPSNARFAEVYPRTNRALFNLAVSVSMVHLKTRTESVRTLTPPLALIT